jgi:phosphopantetheinyl transferase
VNRVILAYTRLPRQLPAAPLEQLAAALPYARRLRLARGARARSRSLAGIALACRLLGRLAGRRVAPAQLRFPTGGKPHAPGMPDFSITHAGDWVACALATHGRIGLDLELPGARVPRGTLADWVAREAVIKAAGATLAGMRAVRLGGGGALYSGRRWHLCAPRLPLPGELRLASSLPVARCDIERVA